MVLPTYFIHLSSTSLNILYCSSCHIFWLKWKKCHESLGYIYVSRTLHWGSLWCCIFFSILFHILFFSIYFISWRLITILQWFLSYIDMNQPWIYMCSPSQFPLPPPFPPYSSRSSQWTRSERLSHASNLGWWSVSL